MKFDVSVIAKSFPTICLIVGAFLLVGSVKLGFGLGIGFVGGLLIVAAICLYVYYLKRRYQ